LADLLDWSMMDKMCIITIIFLLFMDSLLVCGVTKKFRPEPDLLIPWLTVYLFLIPAELLLAVVIIVHHPHPISALLLIPPAPYTYLWVAVNSYREQVVRTQDAVKILVFQSRGQMNPSQKLFRKAFENEFKSTYELAAEVVEVLGDNRSSSEPELGRSCSPLGRRSGSHMELPRRQRTPSNNSVYDLLQRELVNLQGSYKPEVYENRSTWSNSVSNSPSMCSLNMSPASTPGLSSPAPSRDSSPSSTRSISTQGSRQRMNLDNPDAGQQKTNFLTPDFVPRVKCKRKGQNTMETNLPIKITSTSQTNLNTAISDGDILGATAHETERKNNEEKTDAKDEETIQSNLKYFEKSW